MNIVSIRMVISLKPPQPPRCLSLLLFVFFFLFCTAIRFSPSKRTRTSIPALKSSSQEILSSLADERSREDRKGRLGGAYSLASLDGRGTQKHGYKSHEITEIQVLLQGPEQPHDLPLNSCPPCPNICPLMNPKQLEHCY